MAAFMQTEIVGNGQIQRFSMVTSTRNLEEIFYIVRHNVTVDQVVDPEGVELKHTLHLQMWALLQ